MEEVREGVDATEAGEDMTAAVWRGRGFDSVEVGSEYVNEGEGMEEAGDEAATA